MPEDEPEPVEDPVPVVVPDPEFDPVPVEPVPDDDPVPEVPEPDSTSFFTQRLVMTFVILTKRPMFTEETTGTVLAESLMSTLT